jgi:hypothetical protein
VRDEVELFFYLFSFILKLEQIKESGNGKPDPISSFGTREGHAIIEILFIA